MTFDGIAAPLTYAGANQINAIVPFGVAGKSTTVVEVAAPSNRTYSVSLAVTGEAPAVFTTTTSGSGQGAILNADLSVNSAAHPAARGSYISIYATGTGSLSPSLPDGTLVSKDNLPTSQAPVSVTIGGQATKVSYQGGAPGLVAGVMQINAEVPAGITPGSAVPVVISAGSTASLNTVTIAIQ